MKTIVTKFGGSSLADANQFKKVKEIINADAGRRCGTFSTRKKTL